MPQCPNASAERTVHHKLSITQTKIISWLWPMCIAILSIYNVHTTAQFQYQNNPLLRYKRQIQPSRPPLFTSSDLPLVICRGWQPQLVLSYHYITIIYIIRPILVAVAVDARKHSTNYQKCSLLPPRQRVAFLIIRCHVFQRVLQQQRELAVLCILLWQYNGMTLSLRVINIPSNCR